MINSENSQPDDLRAHIHKALRAWHDPKITPSDSLSYLLLVKQQRKSLRSDSISVLRRATNEVLQAGLDELEKSKALESNIIKRHFIEGDTHAIIAKDHRDLSTDMVKNRQADGINALTDIIWQHEENEREVKLQKLLNALHPPTYTNIVGIEKQYRKLIDAFLPPSTLSIVAITGIGGIGKTALADFIVRAVARQFHYEEIIWLHVTESMLENGHLAVDRVLNELAFYFHLDIPSNRPTEQRYSQLKQNLNHFPHLVVIDNLETEISTDFLVHLKDFGGVSKFLLTSRLSLPNEAGVLSLRLDELAILDAVSLVQNHAHDIGLHELADFTIEDIRPVYEIVGGNPLALKLVVGLVPTRPLSQILDDLIQIHTKKIEDLYLNIYWQAWHTLNGNAHKLLESMYAADEIGILPDQMMFISKLSDAELWQATDELVKRSLLEVRGTVHEKRYGIHRLTASFLKTEIIKWPDDEMDT